MLVVLPNAYGDAATNMAIDAALLETLPGDLVVFRHYGWMEPAFTFGYSQRFDEVASHTPGGVNLCRRMTGGGIVDHRNDWTYTLVLGKSLDATQSPSTELYLIIHESIAAALSLQGIATQLAPCPRKCDEAPDESTGPNECFVQPVMNDVLGTDGTKIAGAAMKRSRKGLLIQGSIDKARVPDELDFTTFQSQFIASLSESLSIPIKQADDLRPLFNSHIIEEEKQKFSSAEWTKRR